VQQFNITVAYDRGTASDISAVAGEGKEKGGGERERRGGYRRGLDPLVPLVKIQ